ncbi:MAG: ABC transporter ATP-binding protein [Dehalococcoidales bacterium]|nr:ABC transporter ATP-binding protein [Dehalococcoidales bacterium]
MLAARLNETSNKDLLSVSDLCTWFELRKWGFGRAGFVRAVDGLSFDLSYGEAIAIVGESGCGKSTLAKTILGLHHPTKGEIIFEGKPISAARMRQRQDYRSCLGYVQQDPYGALAPFMNVRRILTEPLVINGISDRGERENRIREVLEDVKLSPPDEFLGKFPHMLSGGQQQRLVIARAIILRPGLIVADEPVSMLDASVRVEVLELLRQLQQIHSLSLIYITHDLATVRFFSERVFVMYAGKLIEKAVTSSLLSNPYHPYTRALIAAISDPDPANVDTFKEVPPGEPPSLLNPPSGCRFHPRCPSMISGLCEQEEPSEFTVRPSHSVMCWLYR